MWTTIRLHLQNFEKGRQPKARVLPWRASKDLKTCWRLQPDLLEDYDTKECQSRRLKLKGATRLYKCVISLSRYESMETVAKKRKTEREINNKSGVSGCNKEMARTECARWCERVME